MTFVEFNKLEKDTAAKELFACCGSSAFVTLVMNHFPFAAEKDLLNTAERVWYNECNVADWKESFTHHPKIGDKKSLQQKFAGTEQSGVATASAETIQALADANTAYEKKNGFIFIVCATGKSAEEMLLLLKHRLKNSAEEELPVAMNEQHKITLLRFNKLFDETNFQFSGMSQITTHVLDTSIGKPGKNMAVKLLQQTGQQWQLVAQGITNSDGRVADLLPQGKKLLPGIHKIVFDTGAYFSANNIKGFYPEVEIQFTVFDDGHYHVPLLINPFGYSTYRGS